MKIIYGTSNKGKIEQVKEYLAYKNEDVEIISLKDIGFDEEIIEDGKTFEENSLIKAKAIKKFCEKNNIKGMILTDDAGLCVDALNGEPGVYSARYAGDHASQIDSITKVLDQMKEVEDEKRTAKFVCVLTLMQENGEVKVVRGETLGKIVKTPGPLGKLTYGPIFTPNGFSKTMNELTDAELGNTYRVKALDQLLKYIKNENIGFYAGSFDPFTKGHMHVVKTASNLFDKLIIGIGVNIKKGRTYDKDKMKQAIEEALKTENINNAQVITYEGLSVDAANKYNCNFLVRGIRDDMDYYYEENIAEINEEISGLDTIYVRAGNLGGISSSTVKELFTNGKDVSRYVPREIINIM